MNKFEASKKFINALKISPDDFSAKVDSGRDHYYYIISHKIVPVSICIDSTNNVLTSSRVVNTDLYFVDSTDLKFLVNWAQERIAKDEEQKKVLEDNGKINELIKFYIPKSL